TGHAQAQQASKDTSGFLNIFQDFLLAFAGVALFVGSFVIANTLSITIAQRTRELATMRTLGATRRQVLTSVLLEAFVIGVLATLAVAAVLLVVGMLSSGLSTGLRLLAVGLGTLVLFAGVAALAPTLVPRLARLLGAPAARFGGAAGRLARGNAVRNPARTAS